jgi:CubicO group peptidase (beta-lactamase class C family)
MKSIFIYLILFFTTVSIGSTQEIDENKINKIDTYLKNTIDNLQIVGLNYAILIDNKIIHEKSFGLANAQLKTPMTLDNSFPIASISKLFSSIALHKLLSIHKIDINATVGTLLPNRNDLPESWKKLTLNQLLSHSSGIPDQIDYQIYLAPENEEFVIDALKNKPFSFKPGTESKYNATGFLLIRIIIEKLAKQDFETHMQEQYFDKTNLNSAKYGGFKSVINDRVTCYQNVNDKLEMFPLNYSAPMYAGAGLNIALKDLVKWFQAIQGEQILTKEELERIWMPVKLKKGNDGYFGLGWESYKLKDGYNMIGHGGAGISSFRHFWNKQSNQNLTIILLTNGALNWKIRPNQINLEIANMIFEK